MLRLIGAATLLLIALALIRILFLFSANVSELRDRQLHEMSADEKPYVLVESGSR